MVLYLRPHDFLHAFFVPEKNKIHLLCQAQVTNITSCPTATPEQLQNLMGLMGKMAMYAPDLVADGKSPASTPEEAIPRIRAVWEKASIENGDGGAFVSHFGNKQWL